MSDAARRWREALARDAREIGVVRVYLERDLHRSLDAVVGPRSFT